MTFMLAGPFEVLPLTLMAPVLWGALIAIIWIGVLASRKDDRDPEASIRYTAVRWVSEMAPLFLIPVAIVMIGHYCREVGISVNASRDMIIAATLYTLGVIQVAVAVWLIWRHRSRSSPMTAIAVLTTWWTSGAMFVSWMSMTDNWL